MPSCLAEFISLQLYDRVLFFFFFFCQLEAKNHSQFPETSLRSLFYGLLHNIEGFPGSSIGKESAFSAGNLVSIPGLGRAQGLRRKWQPTPVFLTGKTPWTEVRLVPLKLKKSICYSFEPLRLPPLALISSFIKELAWLDKTYPHSKRRN